MKKQLRAQYNKIHSFLGFTLIELLIALIILASLAALATPSLLSLLESNSLTSTSNEISLALNSARQTAISKNLATFVCHTNAVNDSNSRCNSGNNSNWNTGYLIYHSRPFRDTNELQSYTGTPELLVKTFLFQNDFVSAYSSSESLTSSQKQAIIGFNSKGFLLNSDAVVIDLCANNKHIKGKRISVSLTGRVQVKEQVCN